MLRPFALACLLAATTACGIGNGRAAEVSCTFTDPKGAPIADAVVSLTPLAAPAKLTPPAEPVELGQSGQEFQRFVTPILVGGAVSFPNEDKVGHEVYSLSPAKKFAFPLYKPGTSSTLVFDRPGVVALGCNIHDWMLAYIVVLDTPFFAQSRADGTATITAPPGRYRLEVWHPRLAKNETRELTLTAEAPPPAQAFTLALKPDRRIRRMPGAGGGGYNK